ncbi:MAG: hypothetical protein L0Y75_10020, partial [Acidobacteria bacterium]|nr:hypothetical protein [Acidobacteriota bacterium]
MKRQLIPHVVILSVLVLFSSLNASFKVYAQSGTGELPGAKPTPAPKGSKPTKPVTPAAPSAPVTPTLTFGEETKGKLDPRTSDKGAAGTVFEEHILNAKSEDWLTFRIESENPSLGLQILDKDKAEVAVAKDSSGGFKINTQTGGLPADGEYRVRVMGAVSGRNTVPFTLKVLRPGLTPAAYAERFQKIYANYRESDPASADETLTKLEELGKDDTSRPTTFEMLGIIYLYNRKDVGKAEQAMEQAIKANGAAVVKISFDGQWRRAAKLRSGNFGFEDARTGWLRIRPGQLVLTDPSNKTLASLNGQQIKEMSKIVTAASNMVTIT